MRGFLALMRALGPVAASDFAGMLFRMVGWVLPVGRVAAADRFRPGLEERGRANPD